MYCENYIQQMIQLLELKGCIQGTIREDYTCMKKVLTFLNKPVDDIAVKLIFLCI